MSAQGRNRTADTGIFSPLLYQLSYLGEGAQWYEISVPSSSARAKVLVAAFVAAGPASPRTAQSAVREIFLTAEPRPEGPEETDLPKETGLSNQPTSAAGSPPPSAEPNDAGAGEPRRGPGGEIRVFGGMHQPTFGVALAFDWAFRRAALGLQVDYAAWLSLDSLSMHPGALHVAATGQHRLPLGRLSLRQRAALGTATLVAARGPHAAGATGLFFEVAPLGLELHTRISRMTFVFEAFSLALSAPVLGADPVIQTQYRATLGLRF